MRKYVTSSMGYAHAPRAFRIPGDIRRERSMAPELEGAARRNITRELSWHGTPAQIEQLGRGLVTEREIDVLSDVEQQYLGLILFSLNQMQATGALSPPAAWEIFNFEVLIAKNAPFDDASLPANKSEFLMLVKKRERRKWISPMTMESLSFGRGREQRTCARWSNTRNGRMKSCLTGRRTARSAST